jgi:hypothetical protein
MGRPSEQAGVLWDCDCVGGGAEADCVGCDCGEDPLCAFREIGALKTRASSTSLRQLDLRPELKLRMIHSHDQTTAYTPPPPLGHRANNSLTNKFYFSDFAFITT